MDAGADTLDSDANITTGKTICTTLSPGETDLTWDAGMYEPEAKIGDYVWNDLNKDGIQNVSESGIPGITVELYNCTDILIDTTTTNATGYYNFTVPAGDYYVNFTLPSGMVFSPMDAGGDSVDSDANLTTGKSICTTLTPGETDLTWDAGMYEPEAMIGDYVWDDTNKDGIQNVSESGIPGVIVDLMQGSIIISTNTTNASGIYLFDNLVAGCYNVTINSSNFGSGGALEYYTSSPFNVGADDAIDSDGINNASSVCVAAGDVNLTIDFGYHKPVVYNAKTIGYWKNHPDDWPTESVTIGGVPYTKAEAIDILKDAKSKDATDMLAAQLIAAQLNIDKFGAGTSDILQIILDSNDFLIQHPIGSNPQGDDRDDALDLKDLLDEYNNMWDT